MKPAFADVVIFCPERLTGGPYALHQLAWAINTLGGNASLLYMNDKSSISVDRGRFNYSGQLNQAFVAAHQHLSPKPFSSCALGRQSLFIFPETTIRFMAHVPQSSKGIWWLSVDTAFANYPELNDAKVREQLFRDPDIYHFYQSEYAKNFLQVQGARRIVPLFDFLDTPPEPGASEKRFDYACFPRKGGELAQAFAAQATDLRRVAIENMGRAEVYRALGESTVYIDFGHHPGKDRVPREAAVSGAIVLLHEQGAARFYNDHPLDRLYTFATEEVGNGGLLNKLRAILRDSRQHVGNQTYYRSKIFLAEEEFAYQVQSFFFEQHQPVKVGWLP